VSLFGAYEFGKPEMVALRGAVVEDLIDEGGMNQQEAAAWGKALSFHHQWMVLSREHAAALVHHRHDVSKVRGCQKRPCCAVTAGCPNIDVLSTGLLVSSGKKYGCFSTIFTAAGSRGAVQTQVLAPR
jgi:hypothetical protein